MCILFVCAFNASVLLSAAQNPTAIVQQHTLYQGPAGLKEPYGDRGEGRLAQESQRMQDLCLYMNKP